MTPVASEQPEKVLFRPEWWAGGEWVLLLFFASTWLGSLTTDLIGTRLDPGREHALWRWIMGDVAQGLWANIALMVSLLVLYSIWRRRPCGNVIFTFLGLGAFWPNSGGPWSLWLLAHTQNLLRPEAFSSPWTNLTGYWADNSPDWVWGVVAIHVSIGGLMFWWWRRQFDAKGNLLVASGQEQGKEAS